MCLRLSPTPPHPLLTHPTTPSPPRHPTSSSPHPLLTPVLRGIEALKSRGTKGQELKDATRELLRNVYGVPMKVGGWVGGWVGSALTDS